MTQKDSTSLNPFVRFWGMLVIGFLFLAACITCLKLFPADSSISEKTDIHSDDLLAEIPLIEDLVPQEDANLPVVEVSYTEGAATKETPLFAEDLTASFNVAVADYGKQLDVGLALYRSVHARTAVEWFYVNVTGDQDVALAILQEADKNNIPLSLAFALAYSESRYRITAVNRNTNSSIDRGLFQLNNKSFPSLVEEDFFDPYISAKYGLSHLRFCLDTAGNEVSALAMYNAGTNRVRNNGTPQMTLNYISNIQSYREGLDSLFESEIVEAYGYNNQSAVAMLTK